MAESEFLPPRSRTTVRYWLAGVLTVVAVPALAWVTLLLWAPTRVVYIVDGGRLEIRTRLAGLWSSKSIPLGAIQEVREVSLEGGSRRAGTTLPGYCQGRFAYPGLGTVWQATDCSRTALLLLAEGEARPVVVTPPDRVAFQASLRGGGSGRLEVVLDTTRRSDAMLRVMRVVVLLMIPVMLAVPVLLVIAPQRLRYRLEPGVLVVQTWCSEKRFPLTGAVVTPGPAGRALKVAGSAAPGYYAGRFRVDGKSTRIYATTLKDGVLVEGETRVFVSPADPGGFMAALVTSGARRG